MIEPTPNNANDAGRFTEGDVRDGRAFGVPLVGRRYKTSGTKKEKMKQRPSFEDVYMKFADLISRRSTCKRLSVGTVITTTDFRKVLAVGYNGNASGLRNSCDRDEPGNCGCLHSEENAIINCDSPRETKKFVFVTHLPCPACAKRLINLGHVQKVVYRNSYRKTTSLEIFESVGIQVYQYEEQA